MMNNSFNTNTGFNDDGNAAPGGDRNTADVVKEIKATQAAGGSSDQDTDEATKRAEHEAAEARRKAEWEARQQARKAAELERLCAMSEDELVQESMKRVGADTEKLTRRNMKECVLEYVQTLCLEDLDFARLTMLPRKTMIRCFQYINRKAWDYVQDEMKANGGKLDGATPVYGSDVPDDLCYQWAEEYFRNPDVKEDMDEDEEFIPKPYVGTYKYQSGKKKADKNKARKVAEKEAVQQKTEEKALDGQISIFDQMSQDHLETSVMKTAV